MGSDSHTSTLARRMACSGPVMYKFRMQPQARPVAPAPGPALSMRTTSEPLPFPVRSSSMARWYAVDRPWMPAPTTTKRAEDGSGAASWIGTTGGFCITPSTMDGDGRSINGYHWF